MNQNIERIKKAVEPLRQEIINHRVYPLIKDINDLRIFTQFHVYAVWDFMSLLKTLQASLTCTTVPWFPKGSAETRFLINEIVVGEESDVDLHGIRKSHFELYLDAMNECGADLGPIHQFLATITDGQGLAAAFAAAGAPPEAIDFVNFTFQIIDSKKDYLQAAIFTFGREDLIPGMFISMVNDLDTHNPESISLFKYYLERHIEVDGGHHSHLAMQMMANLCGNDEQKWNEAEEAILISLQKRIKLWDGVYRQILAK